MAPAVRTLAAYAASVALLTYYGTEVCPYLESLPWHVHAATLGAFFAAGYAVRAVLLRRLASSAGLPDPLRYLVLELSIWIGVGLAVTAWNMSVHRFPAASGLKIVLGCLTLGIFGAAYLALDVERRLIDRLAASGRPIEIRSGTFLSISTRFLVFFIVSIVVVSFVLLLLIARDLAVLHESAGRGEQAPFGAMVREVVFVFGLLVGATSVLARNYSRNLHRMFELQLDAFRSVERGDYSTFVPVVTNDEFGLIAETTNHMIAGLQEKERIRKAFGKYVSPLVADSILGSEEGSALGGRQTEVAVLFTDIRNYTALSERRSPPEIVALLNEHFTRIVDRVHAEGGVLDKFIGDAAMAVFGLDDPTTACERAVRAALAIRENMDGRLETGIGIHYGPVVAGNIGSAERLEYTVIGDAVNVAARLESLTKELAAPLAISAAVHDRLPEDLRARFASRGEHALKGKAAAVPVYSVS
mgnify:CR=1 FL=1